MLCFATIAKALIEDDDDGRFVTIVQILLLLR